jgi:hypothetical protein
MGNDYDKIHEVIERGTTQLFKQNPPRLVGKPSRNRTTRPSAARYAAPQR